MGSSSYQRWYSASNSGSISAHTINKPVPRVLAMPPSLAARPFKHASSERGEDEMTTSRQSAGEVYNGAPATFRRAGEQASDRACGDRARHQTHHPAMEPGNRGR